MGQPDPKQFNRGDRVQYTGWRSGITHPRPDRPPRPMGRVISEQWFSNSHNTVVAQVRWNNGGHVTTCRTENLAHIEQAAA